MKEGKHYQNKVKYKYVCYSPAKMYERSRGTPPPPPNKIKKHMYKKMIHKGPLPHPPKFLISDQIRLYLSSSSCSFNILVFVSTSSRNLARSPSSAPRSLSGNVTTSPASSPVLNKKIQLTPWSQKRHQETEPLTKR